MSLAKSREGDFKLDISTGNFQSCRSGFILYVHYYQILEHTCHQIMTNDIGTNGDSASYWSAASQLNRTSMNSSKNRKKKENEVGKYLMVRTVLHTENLGLGFARIRKFPNFL